MRRIVMFNRVTPEGHFTAMDGNYQELIVPDDGIDRFGAEAIPKFDTVLLGRRTYELFAAFWPYALDDRSLPPALCAMAVGLNEMTKMVFSKTLPEATWRNSRVVRTLDPGEIEAMKRQPGRDIVVLGSGTIVSQLTRHGLIDEYQLVLGPVLVGNGRPLIDTHGVPARLPLDLVEATAYPSGNVLLRYALRR
jgi:dihydrofolate reductase